jgi:hypothetical protein
MTEILTTPLQVKHSWVATRPPMFHGGQNLPHLHFPVFQLAIGQRTVNDGSRSGSISASLELQYYTTLVIGSTTSDSQNL